MDGVLVDFQSGIKLLSDKELVLFENKFDEVPGIFSKMKPIDGALEAFEKLNNHFGIVGDCRYDITNHQSKYRYYPTITDAYIGFCTLVVSKKFYESMKGNTDENLWLKKLGATGYASNPNWPTTVYKVVTNSCH
jgi:hypothetical protein